MRCFSSSRTILNLKKAAIQLPDDMEVVSTDGSFFHADSVQNFWIHLFHIIDDGSNRTRPGQNTVLIH